MPARFESHPILIASSEYDSGATRPVVERLEDRGRNVILLETDRIDSGEVPFAIRVARGGLEVQLGDRHFRPSEVAAAWYRRPRYHGLKENSVNKYASSSLYTEVHRGIWDSVDDTAWLNSPVHIRRADNKFGQLLLAQSHGFTIPDTIVTNRWQQLSQFPYDTLVTKFAGKAIVPDEDGGFNMLYSNVIPNDLGTQVAAELTQTAESPVSPPYPPLWQPYLQKAREWRLTIVGDNSFDAVVRTSSEANDDWRRHQMDTEKVQFERGTFPENEKIECHRMLGALGLRFGIFEFIESPDGELTFLELNPNGQYGWLEERLGLPISDAITDELCAIADSRAA